MNDGQVTGLDALCRQAALLIDAAPGPLKSVRLTAGDMSVEVEWPQTTSGPPGPDGRAEEPEPVAASDGSFPIQAPLVGTFYRAPSPDDAPFVQVGDVVEAGQQVAIVEAMKLMNAVEADRPGRVVAILAGNGSPVEYGEPLFSLAPL